MKGYEFLSSDSESGNFRPGSAQGHESGLAATSDGATVWTLAQARLAAPLARSARVVGAFDERLSAAPTGARFRLIHDLSARICGAVGDAVFPPQLALWRAGQLYGVAPQHPGFQRAARVFGALDIGIVEFPGADEGERLHPLVRAGHALFHASTGTRSADLHADALAHAASLAAHGVAPHAGFVPFAPDAIVGDNIETWLSGWLNAVERGTHDAMTQLAALSAWRQHANGVVMKWSGRIPSRLIAVIGAWPVVSATIAQAESGASRAAVQRNLDRLVADGLIHEMTGQGRYRLWTATLASAK